MVSKTIQKNSQNNLQKTVNVKNETEAEQLIKNLRKEGNNPRAILKIKIMIDGERFPLNIAKIVKICKSKQNSKRKTEFIDADFIKLYKQGFTPNDVVPRLKCPYDDAEKVFVKFQKYSGMTLASLDELDILYSHLRKIDPDVQTLADAFEAVKTAVEHYQMLQTYAYRCDICGEQMLIGPCERSSVLKHLKDSHFCHAECLEESHREKVKQPNFPTRIRVL